jgi:hypothetical protein
MSGLLDSILAAGNGNVVDQLAQQFGTNPGQTRDALSQLTRVLGGSLARQTSTDAGLGGLFGALDSGNHARYLDALSALSHPAAREDGNAILGHVLGSKDTSREVAAKVGANTGLDPAIIRQMLPLAATLMMGFLSKQRSSGALRPPAASATAASASPLAAMLDANRDGSIADDLMNLAGRFLH